MKDRFAITVEYDGQSENMIAKCEYVQNAAFLSNLIMKSSGKSPIVRVLDLKDKRVLTSYKRELKEADYTTIMFGGK